MPSSPGIGASSPLRDARRSRFTYRHLAQLATYSTTSPLRVIAHIDLDAFYAQCEMIRLGVPEDKPLAVQQWQGLIAINYAAREWGIGRHCNITEAKKLCPDLIAQHVATWREGDDKWAYRDDAAANIASDKVSLDPYRLQSRKILALVKKALPQDMQRVEKASIDEVFLDLSAQVHKELLQRFPELSYPPPYDDATERLPHPSVAALDWQADALIDLGEEEEGMDPDWDDVAIFIGSEIVRGIRAEVRKELGYTCSAGIAHNKLISKLGSAFRKPNCQTVVRSQAIPIFLAGIKVTKMRNLGGKLGEEVVAAFNTEDITELLKVPLSDMNAKLGAESGLWVYNTIRGIDVSEVNSRTQIKSMLSAKSFRPYIYTQDQAAKWLRIFSGDIYSRLVEEGVLEHKRRPRVITLHHRHSGLTKSRRSQIPLGKVLEEQTLFDLASQLLHQIISEGNVWPCANLSLSVSGFEDGVKGNVGIDAFLVRDEEATTLRTTSAARGSIGSDRPSKRFRPDDSGIHRFFAKKSPAYDGVANDQQSSKGHGSRTASPEPIPTDLLTPSVDSGSDECSLRWNRPLSIGSLGCSKCKAQFDDPALLQSHEDWHFAKELQDQERVTPTFAERSASNHSQTQGGLGVSSKRAGRGGVKPEQGQSKLKFGG